jgi:hypothetical protein
MMQPFVPSCGSASLSPAAANARHRDL